MTISSLVSMRGVVVLATLGVASCAPSNSLQQVKTSNPSVTYEYRGDQELLQAQQNAVTFCNQYQSAHRPARFTSGPTSSSIGASSTTKGSTPPPEISWPE